LGHVRFRDWRFYGEEGLARQEAAVRLQLGSLTLEYGGEMLSTYDVELAAATGELRTVGGARLFKTSYLPLQLRLFALDDAGWLKALELNGYAPQRPQAPLALQEVLFSYLEAL
jgi:hypothetical protein